MDGMTKDALVHQLKSFVSLHREHDVLGQRIEQISMEIQQKHQQVHRITSEREKNQKALRHGIKILEFILLSVLLGAAVALVFSALELFFNVWLKWDLIGDFFLGIFEFVDQVAHGVGLSTDIAPEIIRYPAGFAFLFFAVMLPLYLYRQIKKFQNRERERETIKQTEREIEQLEKQKIVAQAEMQDLIARLQEVRLPHPLENRDISCITEIYQLCVDSRADSLKEALNIYEHEELIRSKTFVVMN